MSSSKNLNDKWFRIIGITGVALVAQVLFYRDMNQARGIPFLKGYVHSISCMDVTGVCTTDDQLHTQKIFFIRGI